MKMSHSITYFGVKTILKSYLHIFKFNCLIWTFKFCMMKELKSLLSNTIRFQKGFDFILWYFWRGVFASPFAVPRPLLNIYLLYRFLAYHWRYLSAVLVGLNALMRIFWSHLHFSTLARFDMAKKCHKFPFDKVEKNVIGYEKMFAISTPTIFIS